MDAGRTLLWGHLVGLVLLAAWAPFDPSQPSIPAMATGTGAGLFGLAGLFFLYTGLARGRAAVVAPTAAVVGAVVPVDLHIPGCPPTPVALLKGLLTLLR